MDLIQQIVGILHQQQSAIPPLGATMQPNVSQFSLKRYRKVHVRGPGSEEELREGTLRQHDAAALHQELAEFKLGAENAPSEPGTRPATREATLGELRDGDGWRCTSLRNHSKIAQLSFSLRKCLVRNGDQKGQRSRGIIYPLKIRGEATKTQLIQR